MNIQTAHNCKRYYKFNKFKNLKHTSITRVKLKTVSTLIKVGNSKIVIKQ